MDDKRIAVARLSDPASGSAARLARASRTRNEYMIVGIVKETFPGERRVALVPDTVPVLTAAGLEVLVETGAGDASVPKAAARARIVR